MGLAVVHGIVKDHGGLIEVESERDKGATFKVLFPVTESPCSSEAVAPALSRGHERILVVDDEADLATAIGDMLESLGYETLCRTSSPEALQTFLDQSGNQPIRSRGHRHDHAVFDRRGVCERTSPVEAGTADNHLHGLQRTYQPQKIEKLGIKGFLMKPVSLGDLAALVRKVLDETVMRI